MSAEAVFAALVMVAGWIAPSAFAAGGLSFPHTRWDFGAVADMNVKEHAFEARNAGSRKLKITAVSPSCGCTAAVAGKKELRPGESTAIKVSFNPAGKSGKVESSVTVRTDQGTEVVLTIAANVVARQGGAFPISVPAASIRVTPEKVHLGKVIVGQPVFYREIVENTGEGELYILNVPAQNEAGQLLGTKPIAKGKKVELMFVYVPDKKGKIEDFAVIKSNDPARPEVKIALTGMAE